MCQKCEWGNPVRERLEELIDKYQDWLEHSDDLTEQAIVEEVIDDLKLALRGN